MDVRPRSGIHRDLAILGTSEHCIATHPSDMAVALAVLDAVIHVEGPSGARTIEFDELYRAPGDDPSRDTMLDEPMSLSGVELPPASTASRRSAYRKARDRASFAFATGAVAIGRRADATGCLTDVRIALGAVAPHPWRARVAEEPLRGACRSARLGRGRDRAGDAGCRLRTGQRFQGSSSPPPSQRTC